MDRKALQLKLKEHLLKTVGKKPSKEEMAEASKKIHKGYDKIYPFTDRNESLVGKTYTEISKEWEKVVASETHLSEIILFQKYTKVKPEFKITSLASGLAVYELFLAKEFVPKGFVTCIDISEGMSKKASDFAKKLKQNNVKIVNGSVLNVPLDDNSQDIVLARRTGLSKDKKWIDVLKEARRILKKKETSTFIYTVDKVFNDSLDKIKSNLSKAKFKFVAMEEQHKSNEGTVCMIIAKPS